MRTAHPLDPYRGSDGKVEVYNPDPGGEAVIRVEPARSGFIVMVGYIGMPRIGVGSFYLCDYHHVFAKSSIRKVRRRARQLRNWYDDYVFRAREADVMNKVDR